MGKFKSRIKLYGIGLALALIGVPFFAFLVFGSLLCACGAIFGIIGCCFDTSIRYCVYFVCDRLRNRTQPTRTYATNDDDRY